MKDITVRKSDLLETLQKNRSAHRAIFEEALDGYRQRVVSELQERLDAALSGKKWDALIVLTQPEDHTVDYDRAIRMLEMDISDTVTISQQDFTSFVDDEWGWKDRFLVSNSAYSATAERATADRNINSY